MKKLLALALVVVAVAGCEQSVEEQAAAEKRWDAKIIVNKEMPNLGFMVCAKLNDETKIWKSSGKQYTEYLHCKTREEGISEVVALMDQGVAYK